MRLNSTAFQDGEQIPKKYTEDGSNVSPELRWSDVPAKTQEFALIVDDPDAPRADPWVHWVLYGIPPDTQSLSEAVPRQESLSNPRDAVQGLNSWPQNNVGYRGPAPPKGHGTHHYHFKLYALDRPLGLAPGLGDRALAKAMEGHVLAEAELMGTYART